MKKATEVTLAKFILTTFGILSGAAMSYAFYLGNEVATLKGNPSLEGWLWPACIAIVVIWGGAGGLFCYGVVLNSLRAKPGNLGIVGCLPMFLLFFTHLWDPLTQTGQAVFMRYLTIGLIFALAVTGLFFHIQRQLGKSQRSASLRPR